LRLSPSVVFYESEVLIMKKLILLTIVVCCYAWPVYGAFPTSGATQDNYCFVPPYLTQNVKPNITILQDLSGSMQFPAYMDGNISGANYSSYTWDVGSKTLTGAELYSSTKDYYGYFDKTKYYKYNTTSNYFEANTTCTDTNRTGSISGTGGSTSCVSGNLLNWIITTRQDTVRKILTGGRVKSGTTTTTSAVLESDGAAYVFTDSNLKCKFTVTASNNATGSNSNTYAVTRKIAVANQGTGTANACSLGTLAASFTNVLTPITEVDGIIQGLYNQAVLQVAVFAETTGDIRVIKGQPVGSYVSAINGELAYGGTPTGTGISQVKYFYQQSTSLSSSNQTVALNKGNYTKDPYYDSDGGTTPSSLPVPCRKSFVLLISDGMWPSGTFDASTTQDPLPHAYEMRKTDMRTGTGFDTPPLDKQTVATYVVYAYGDGAYGRNSLIATAIFGGFDDKYGAHVTPPAVTTTANGWPYPFTAKPTDSRATGTTGNTTPYALSVCNPAGTWHAECAEWDKDRTGLPYNYFEGDDGELLQQQITKAVNDMLTRASSGTAASMLGNTDSSGAVMLQALFFPERQFSNSTKAQWLGDVQAFWYFLDPSLSSTKVTLREDTIEDLKLKKTEDRIARFIFNGTETKVRLYADANGDGVEDPATPYVEEGVDEVRALWRAGLNLWSRMPTGTGVRTIYTNNLSGTATANNMMGFSTANLSLIKPYLDINNVDADGTNVINYTLGIDPDHINLAASEKSTGLAGFRSRTVFIKPTAAAGETHVWKLGDIINSTPKMISPSPLNSYSNAPPGGYRDKSYERFVSTLSYKNRGAAFVGGNDGMLHAFKLGKNIPGSSGYVSQLVNSTDLNGGNPVAATGLGGELWSYIPKNVLPYLKHRGNPNYKHMYFVDSTPTIIDASIAIVDKVCSNDSIKGCSVNSDCGTGTPAPTCDLISPTCTGSNCPKLDTSWLTVLIGSMGLGGATRDSTSTCSITTDCVKTPITGTGFSSYFALDVTDQASPKLLWEFSHPGLGYSTVGPAIVRIKDASETGSTSKNGKFYVVLASGPTGPISSTINQMKAYSDQPLNIYVLDMRTGQAVQTFSNSATALISGVTHKQVVSMPNLAFGGAFSNSTIDTDRGFPARAGNYSDDAIYLGYVRKGVTGDTPTASVGTFAKGGVLRILTGDDPTPNNWTVSKVIDGIGPVTGSIAKLQDTYNKNLWLFFGSGRYFYKNGSLIDEDYTGQNEALYGIKDPCYISDTASTNLNDFDSTCTTTVLLSELKNQTSSASALTTEKGWKIDMGVAGTTFKAKRLYTNPTATSNGVIFFTAFKPSAEVCSYGGDTSIWAVNYSDAGSVAGKNLKGQAMLQLATGELKQIDLATAFTESPATTGGPGRETLTFKGPPSRDETQITSNAGHTPSRKILHIMER
jgi:type IV pilus assembly protein PilY1